MTELEIKTALNKILMSYADTPHARETIIKNFITNEGSVKDYVLALADGLKYGNWPWTSYKPIKGEGNFAYYNPQDCIHANENPNFCPCDKNCYCRQFHCKDKP